MTETRSFKHVVVTGAAGFIGSNLVHWLRANWPQTKITGLDALYYAGNKANLTDLENDDQFELVVGNIADADVIRDLLSRGIDGIINTAAQTHVDRSLDSGTQFVDSNIGGVQNMLDMLKGHNGVRYLQVSTDEVYGSLQPDEVSTETSPLKPRNPYSATKAGADLVVNAYRESFGHDVVTTRCCNNYGPYHYPEKVIPLFITNLMDDKKVPLYGDGLNEREWIHVSDHCAGIARVLEAGRSGEVYNLSTRDSLRNLDLTHKLLAALGKGEDYIEYVKDRPGHDRRYAIDCSKAEKELGWTAQIPFDQGLADTVTWYRENEAWWRPIKSGEYRAYYEQHYQDRAVS